MCVERKADNQQEKTIKILETTAAAAAAGSWPAGVSGEPGRRMEGARMAATYRSPRSLHPDEKLNNLEHH